MIVKKYSINMIPLIMFVLLWGPVFGVFYGQPVGIYLWALIAAALFSLFCQSLGHLWYIFGTKWIAKVQEAFQYSRIYPMIWFCCSAGAGMAITKVFSKMLFWGFVVNLVCYLLASSYTLLSSLAFHGEKHKEENGPDDPDDEIYV